jgi:Tfp pilus assembly PilM family ATPase
MLLGNTASVGIDLGATGMRAIEVGWKNGQPIVERWAAIDFDIPIKDWNSVDKVEIGALIRAALDKKGIRNTWAVHSVSGEAAAPQYFNFPKLLSEDVADAVRLEVEAGLPFRLDDAIISYVLFPDQRLGAAPSSGLSGSTDELVSSPETLEVAPIPVAEGIKARTHGLAIAADRNVVDARVAVLKAAGLETFCVETDGTACGNAFLATGNLKEIDGTTAILNIGHSTTNLTLLCEGTILVRDIPCGGSGVTQAISDTVHLKAAEAEQQKRSHWEKGPSAAEHIEDRMDDILQMSFQDLLDRLRDSVQYWVGERLVAPIGRVLLCGGGSQIRQLPDLLSDVLNVPVERWVPVQHAAAKKDSDRVEWDARLTVAFGLAMRTFPKKGGSNV